MNKASKERLYQDVKFLTEIRPFRNYKNVESLDKAAHYIKDEFRKIGLASWDQIWNTDSFFKRGETYRNVIASYNPQMPKRLIIGAHYDVDGDQEGADDNGSAVAGMLETARLVMENKPELEYGIDFVAYSLEEAPFYHSENMGSYVHAKSMHDKGANVIGMICYEMIGFYNDEPGSQTYPDPSLAAIYPDTANFIITVGVEKHREFNEKVYSLMKEDAAIDVQTITFPWAEGLAVLSDHSSYWKFGYNAVMINDTSFLRNPNYHRESDTIETLNFDRMSAVVDCVYNATVKM